MVTQTVLAVTRENVFTKASLYLETEKKVPTLASIKDGFEKPSSLAIGVYLGEWKQANAELIGTITGNKQSLKLQLAKQEEAIKSLAESNADLSSELTNIKDWLQTNVPSVFAEWESYGAKSE